MTQSLLSLPARDFGKALKEFIDKLGVLRGDIVALLRIFREIEEHRLYTAARDELPVTGAEPARTPAGLLDKLLAAGRRAVYHRPFEVEGVAHRPRRHLDAENRRERARNVGLRKKRRRNAPRLNPARPRHDKGNARTALVRPVFGSAERMGGVDALPRLFGAVFVAVGNIRAVVARENKKRIVVTVLLEARAHLAESVVHLDGLVAPYAEIGLAAEAFVGVARHVHVARAEIEKNVPASRSLEEFVGLAAQCVADVLILPAGCLAAAHMADARYAVDDRLVVLPVARAAPRLEELGVGMSGDLALPLLGYVIVRDFNGIGGIEPHYVAVAQKDAGHSVGRGGENERMIEAHLIGSGAHALVPIGRLAAAPEAEVPLADDASAVAGLAHHRGERELGVARKRQYELGVAVENRGPWAAERVVARQERITARSTDRRRAVRVGKAAALGGELVEIGARYALLAVGRSIAVAEIVDIE